MNEFDKNENKIKTNNCNVTIAKKKDKKTRILNKIKNKQKYYRKQNNELIFNKLFL